MKKIDEVVTRVKADAGDKLADVSDKKAKLIVRLALAEVRRIVNEVQIGDRVWIPELGTFLPRMPAATKEGEQVERRVIFRPAKAKEQAS